MPGKRFLADPPDGEMANSFFLAVGRAVALGTRFEDGCKALAVVAHLHYKGAPESPAEFGRLVTAIFRRRLHRNVTFLSATAENHADTVAALEAANASRNWVAHASTQRFELFLKHPEQIEARRLALHQHALRLGEGIRYLEYMLGGLEGYEEPTADTFAKYPDLLADWVCPQ